MLFSVGYGILVGGNIPRTNTRAMPEHILLNTSYLKTSVCISCTVSIQQVSVFDTVLYFIDFSKVNVFKYGILVAELENEHHDLKECEHIGY
jgi:ABC-type tungstate transport system substrate-binding protein